MASNCALSAFSCSHSLRNASTSIPVGAPCRTMKTMGVSIGGSIVCRERVSYYIEYIVSCDVV